MAKKILEEAMEDAKILKETAIQAAKNSLIEAISPEIREFVESQLGEVGDFKLEAGGEGKEDDEVEVPELPEMDKEVGDEEEEVEESVGMPNMSMVPEAKEEDEEDEEDTMEEKMVPEAKDEDEEEGEEEMEEVVDITTEDLKQAFSEVLKKELSEATVTKSFGAVQDATPKSAGGKAEKGIADEKSGEHQWSDETPPDAKDFTVKEAALRKQLKALAEERNEYKEACMYLKRQLQEVNLFNSKLLYTNKVLQSATMSNKQRLAVIEAFDRAQSMREVELTYKTLSESLKIAGVIGEAKKVSPKGPKSSRFTTPSSTLLKESIQKEGVDTQANRWVELAGLVK